MAFLTALLTDGWLAARNVLRHGRRSVGGAVAVIFGTVALILAAGFIEWVIWGMREGTIHSGLGHIQVVRPGYFELGNADPFAYVLPLNAPEKKMIEARPDVEKVAPRLKFSGLAGHGDTSVAFLGTGLVPKLEGGADNVSELQGKPLSDDDRTGVLVGKGLAAVLGVGVGDSLVLLVNTRGGALGGVEVKVRGVFTTLTKAYDDVAMHVPFALADDLLHAHGAHVWVVYLRDTSRTPQVVNDLKVRLDGELTLVPWYEAADFYNKTVKLFSRQVLVMKLIIAIVVILSISNTMLMNVMERTDEIATSMALGVRRRQVLSRFLLEGVFLGAFGAVIGVALGYALAGLISRIGIPMPPPPGMARGYVGQILVTPVLVWHALFIAVLTSLVASVYPAWKASRMIIAEALRHGR